MFSPEAQRWLEHTTGIVPQNLRATSMRGATSSTLYLLHDARTKNRRFVLRLFTNREWLTEEPDLPRHEIAALQEARRAEINAPEAIALCDNESLFGAPAVLMSHLDGQVRVPSANLEWWLNALAETLASLHRHRAPEFEWQFESWVTPEQLQVPNWTKQPQLWERAITLWQQGAHDYTPVFIHRDYHPLNTLWQNEALSGVVDWPNACRGPAGADLAHCRCNLMQLFDVETAEEFLRAYQRHGGAVEQQVFWDIDGILDFCLPRPQWYRPWSEFGVPILSHETLQNRAESFLKSVLSHL